MTLPPKFEPLGNRDFRHNRPEWAKEHVVKRSKFTEEQIAFALKQAELGASVEGGLSQDVQPRSSKTGRTVYECSSVGADRILTQGG